MCVQEVQSPIDSKIVSLTTEALMTSHQEARYKNPGGPSFMSIGNIT